MMGLRFVFLVVGCLFLDGAWAQDGGRSVAEETGKKEGASSEAKVKKAGKTKPGASKGGGFSWVAPVQSGALPEGVVHATFHSASMNKEVGYYVYLPADYQGGERRYPVVYHLHGGRPGGEGKSVRLASFVHDAIVAGRMLPTIYVFPNGGPVSWYDMTDRSDALGESVFVKELLPHIDKTYRTWGTREGRALEGYSQGGRGATRIWFKYPELFASVAPGGSGYGNEKRVQENDGYESETLRFLPVGYNTWDLAAGFARQEGRPAVSVLIWDGTLCFNYESNLQFCAFLKELGIEHGWLSIPGVPHSAVGSYEVSGDQVMGHHQKTFRAARDVW